MPVPLQLVLRNRIMKHPALMAMLYGNTPYTAASIELDSETLETMLRVIHQSVPIAIPPIALDADLVEAMLYTLREHVPSAIPPHNTQAQRVRKKKATDPRLAKALEIIDELGYPWYKKAIRADFAAGDTTMVDRLLTQKEKCKRGLGKVDWKNKKVFCSK